MDIINIMESSSLKHKDTNCNTTTTPIIAGTNINNAAATTTTTLTAGTLNIISSSGGSSVGCVGGGININMGAGGTAAPAMSTAQHICSSDSFSIIPPPHHELVSANSIELNAAASLSDDSGVPLTTNSSISSGDSYRIGMCKFEIELVESDGEVSQFDSLDNCSEGGMSAENFNTLKKGPLAPIDPPPEFQDSPQTTLVRSISKNIVNSLRRWTSSQSSFEHLKDYAGNAVVGGNIVDGDCIVVVASECSNVSAMTASSAAVPIVMTAMAADTTTAMNCVNEIKTIKDEELFYAANSSERSLKDSYAMNKHLYSSDSILNSHTDNIYDEPNNIISTSLGNSVDIIDTTSDTTTSSPLPSPPPPVSIIKIKQTLCPYYQDHTRYFKAIPSEIDNSISKAAQRFNTAGLSEIHDYDLYYSVKRNNNYQAQGHGHQHYHGHHHHHHHHSISNQYDSSLTRRRIYSPLSQHTQYCHYYHHHQAATSAAMNATNSTTTAAIVSCMNSCGSGGGNRPNSRNSLNSRLSSSHNSLNVSSANKPDDSIFITQAMSHDALFTREISDFYNVPIDSDIYAFPVDMIQQSSDKDAGNNSATTTLTVCGSGGGKQHMRRAHTDSECIEHAVEHSNGKYRSNHHYQQQQQQQHQGKMLGQTTKSQRRNQRNKRKKRHGGGGGGGGGSGGGGTSIGTGIAGETSDECAGVGSGCGEKTKRSSGGGGKYRTPHVPSSSFHSENETPPPLQEPLHMTLDEVKQFYHTLYSDTIPTTMTTTTTTTNNSSSSKLNLIKINKSSTATAAAAACTMSSKHSNKSTTTTTSTTMTSNGGVKSSHETIWNCSATTARSTTRAGNGGATTRSEKHLSKQQQQQCKHNVDNDKINNNNNNNTCGMLNQHVGNGGGSGGAGAGGLVNTGGSTQQNSTMDDSSSAGGGGTGGNITGNSNSVGVGGGIGFGGVNMLPNNKQLLQTEKKSQFTLNLKQKFCSIFRFRRNHNRCRSTNPATVTVAANTAAAATSMATAASATAAAAIATTSTSTALSTYAAAAAAATSTHNQTGIGGGGVTAAALASASAAASSSSSSATTTTTLHTAATTTTTTSASETETENYLNREQNGSVALSDDKRKKFQSRALPPLPKKAFAISDKLDKSEQKKSAEPRSLQFTSSIEKVKDYGWYWGPLSSEAAEKVLSNEPDGSFIVRDSSDDHYIFSLSFKLNNCVRHVRIEQDQGTFSFGSYAKFKSQTITEFIEKAVEHSRSGRYLFFLHRRPEHGPMRVQLTNPVSRFKHVQSLQHMCRFVILKAVIRKDLIQTLPLPRRLLDYLNYKHCYSEQVESDSSHSQISGDGSM